MINAFIKNQSLRVSQEKLVSDTIDYIEASFKFQTTDWEGLEKWAHFSQGDTVYDIKLENDGIGKEKHLNLTAGYWYLYLHGNAVEDGEVVQRITTEKVRIAVEQTGVLNGDPLPLVPPSVGEQLDARISKLEKGQGGGGSGEPGEDGEDGGYYIPSVSAEGVLSWSASKDDMPPIPSSVVKGDTGADGKNGTNGVPATHSWDGTTLTITSASGTSSANLKGDKGNTGADGVSPTVAVSKSGKVTTITITDANGKKTATINDGADGAAGSDGKDGVGIKSVVQTTTSNADGGSNVVTVTKTDGTTSTFTFKNGRTGATGPQGPAGADISAEIILPPSDVAVIGREYNMYYDAFIYATVPVGDLDIFVTINGGGTTYRLAEVFRFIPTTAGAYTVTVKVRNRLTIATIAEKSMTLYVVANDLQATKNILILGDSYTDAGYYPAEIQHNLSGGKIVSLGTVTDTVTINNKSLTVTHEGRSGWASWDYAGTFSEMMSKFNSENNKFRNPSTNKFDLGYYLDTYHNGATISAIMLNLGENGVGANDANVNGFVELVARIRDYSATLPILIHLTIPQSPQDSKRSQGNTSNDLAKRWRDLINRLISTFKGASGVYLVPVHLVIDSRHDFPTETVAASFRNSATVTRCIDGHPTKEGYLKMADVYYANLLKYMDETVVPDEPDEPTVENLVDCSTATTSPSTTNLFEDVWAVGYHISANNLSANASGCIVTNVFPITKGQKIKIEGIKVSATEDKNRFRWYFFDASGARPYGSYINFATNEGVTGGVTLDTSTNSAVIDTSVLSATFNNIAYARFSAYPAGTNEDIIVTVVE